MPLRSAAPEEGATSAKTQKGRRRTTNASRARTAMTAWLRLKVTPTLYFMLRLVRRKDTIRERKRRKNEFGEENSMQCGNVATLLSISGSNSIALSFFFHLKFPSLRLLV